MIEIDGSSLTIDDVVRVSFNSAKVALAAETLPKVRQSREFVERILKENRVVYGITTGVGELASTFINPAQSETLQRNLVRSHAASVGEPLEEETVRGVILLRANALAKGFSGVREEVIQFLLDLLNHEICPFIPCQGSVGASGDLSPLAHLALVVIGEGECLVEGKRIPSRNALDNVGMKPLTLKAKEGLALINGTQVMCSIGCLAIHRAKRVMRNAQIAGAMSLEALKGTAKAFDPRIHSVRPHPGQIRIAANMLRLVEKSAIIASHEDCDKVQDAYTLRCIPQVYGAILDTIDYASGVISTEINTANDNPLVFADTEEVISGGNFHGEPLAFAMDYLGIAMSEIGNISERTIDRLVNPHLSGLPPFLVAKKGLNSGFMVSQYTAAALVSENKVFATPSSVDSIPTSAGQEDHVSMGTTAARHAEKIIENVQNVLAIEMLSAAQGMDFHDESPGLGTAAAHKLIRKHIPHTKDDRIMYKEIEAIHKLVVSGIIVHEVEQAIGSLDRND